MKQRLIALLLALALPLALLSGCSTGETAVLMEADDSAERVTIGAEPIPLAAGVPAVDLAAVASGTLVQSNSKVLLDYSNVANGYIMVKYSGSNKKVKTIITGPSGTAYNYNQSLTGDYDVFVLSDGSGSYKIAVYENISGTSYSTAFSHTISVKLNDEFSPFLRSNKYVGYTGESAAVKLAADLTKGKKTENDKIKAIYEYAVSNISYDYELAKTVTSGYIPDIDSVLTKKKGICFDYAAVMTAMLRSQSIPTKLVFGYTGSVYHAWISTYSKESGWVTASIYFDGTSWKLMDPTFASTGNSSAEIMKYIGNGKNYTAKYIY